MNKRSRKGRTVAEALNNHTWRFDITGALTIQVLRDYLTIRQRLQAINLNQESDKFIWRWDSSGNYSSRSAYRALFLGQTSLMGVKELWETRAPNKCRFFFWLLLHGRCWTSDRLQRHGLPNHGSCALCAQGTETIDHLITACVFSRETWFRVLRRHGWSRLTPGLDDTTIDWWFRNPTASASIPSLSWYPGRCGWNEMRGSSEGKMQHRSS